VLVALKQATRDTPIVAVAIDYDPLSAGHIASLARPGGWITGVSMQQEELSTKRLELLKELLPKARRIAVLADTSTTRQLALVWAAARRLEVELLIHEFKGAPYDFDAAFAEFARGKAEGLLPLASGLFVPSRRKVTELALKYRLPGMFVNALWVEAGGLISYGVNFPAVYQRIAEIVGMVFKGAKPSELQVEQSANFELTVNMRTAKSLGLTIPKVFLFRADKLIE
jgi:putative tryptophan/tyrosine transport system substrate-binding protein